jgi:hypothetical protein
VVPPCEFARVLLEGAGGPVRAEAGHAHDDFGTPLDRPVRAGQDGMSATAFLPVCPRSARASIGDHHREAG